jgi:hypothetical protein
LNENEEFWSKYQQEVKDFYDWFDETRKKTEASVKGKSGEGKIAATKQLLHFILEAIEKWNEIQCPTSGEWKGDLEVTITSQGMQFPISGTVSAFFQLELLPPRFPVGPSVIKGTISNGATRVNAAGIDFDGDFTGDIVGHGQGQNARICAVFRYSKMMVENPFKANSPMAIFNRVDNDTFYQVWHAFESIVGKTPPMKATDESLYYQLTMQGLEEEFEYMPYLIDYFKLYVKTIDNVHRQKYNDLSDANKKQTLAYETIELLRDALTLGLSLDVPNYVYDEIGLIMANEQSLFDKWFRLWFPAAMEFWNQKVQQKGSLENLSGRVGFILEAAFEKQMGYYSEKPFIDFKLSLPGETMDNAYKVYYPVAVEDWKKKLANDRKKLSFAMEWLFQQSSLVGDTISLQASQVIGLRPSPPKAQQAFMELGGIR